MLALRSLAGSRVFYRSCRCDKIRWSPSSQRGFTSESIDGRGASEGETKSTYIDGVTVVDTVQVAVHVVKKLIELPSTKWVAWSSQIKKADVKEDKKTNEPSPRSISGYAGDDVDFGNGPHLFVPIVVHDDAQREVWKLLKKYFEDYECMKLWYDFSSCRRALAGESIEPRGIVGDLMQMAQLMDNSSRKQDVDALTNKFLNKRKVRDVESLLLRKDLVKSGSLRPWTLKSKSGIDRLWIGRSAADAALIYHLGSELRDRLLSSMIHGINSTEGYKNDIFNLYEAYMYFFGPLARELSDMEQRGIEVNQNVLDGRKEDAEAEKDFLEAKFRQWATQHSPDAALMDLNSPRQLRQLLFAPCQNVHVMQKSLPPIDAFVVADVVPLEEGAEDIRAKRRKRKRRITIVGAGQQAEVFTPSGWPAVSARALRKAAGFPRNVNPTYGKNNSPDFSYAVDDLLRLKSLQGTATSAAGLPLQYFENRDGRLRSVFKMDCDSGKVICEGLSPLLHDALTFAPGKTLIVARFRSLDFCTLAHLSGCHVLEKRLSDGIDFHASGAVLFFDNISRAVNDGLCVVAEHDANDDCCNIDTVRNVFPVEYQTMREIDRFAVEGGSVGSMAKRIGLPLQKVRALTNSWYATHESVADWRRDCLEFARTEGIVETMMGRRRITSNIDASTLRVRENAQNAALRFAVLGSAGEIVMSAVLKLSTNEALKALEWRVVFVDGDEIILEGPTYSAGIATPLVKEDMIAPSDLELGVALNIDIDILGDTSKDNSADHVEEG